jgi:hypothetical protein
MFKSSYPGFHLSNIFTGPYAELYIAAIAAVVFFLILAIYLRIQGKKELMQEVERKTEIESLTNITEMSNQSSQGLGETAGFISRNPEMRRLQLQAYERLIILCERLSFPALLSRLQPNNLSAKDLKQTLIQTIQSEFEYNTSQQLYVSVQAWDAIKNLKEQQIFIINQLSEHLSEHSRGNELASRIAELVSHDENATLHPIVSALINKEAKMLLQAV